MGKCYSRSESVAKKDESKDDVKNSGAEGKGNNEETANGQAENAEDSKTNESLEHKTSLKDKKNKSSKETKTVRITVTTTETKTEMKATKEKSEEGSNDPKPIQPSDVDVDVNDPEVQKAATTIQAGFRGHMARKQLKTPQGQTQEANDDIDLNDPQVNAAAVKIQANFRGHLTRKNLQQ